MLEGIKEISEFFRWLTNDIKANHPYGFVRYCSIGNLEDRERLELSIALIKSLGSITLQCMAMVQNKMATDISFEDYKKIIYESFPASHHTDISTMFMQYEFNKFVMTKANQR